MPFYDLKCRVKIGGKFVSGKGVKLSKETGDLLVSRKMATVTANTETLVSPEPEQIAPVKQDEAPAIVDTYSGKAGIVPRYHAEHKGGGRWYVIDKTTATAVTGALKRDEVQAKADELNGKAE